jgi:hypothetical protein
MREMEEHAYRAELGKRRNRQDGHDRQQGAKLGALPFAVNENPHGPHHRDSVLSRGSERRWASKMCRIGHRNTRWGARNFHKGKISAGGLHALTRISISYSAYISL